MTDALKNMEKLTGDIYRPWKVKMKAHLVSESLWQQADTTVDHVYSTHRQKREQALASIIISLGEDQMLHIEKCETAREGWKNLMSNRMRLYEQLITI